MARPAPGVERTIAVLGFLAAHPGEGFTLSELARRLGLNKATCHALLSSLTDAGYLLRHPSQLTYTLGPALIPIGQAAEGQFEAVDFARAEMRALSDELDLECLATAAVADEMVIVARSGNPKVLGSSPPTGQRLPIAPPLGTVFMAWAGTDAIDAWLQRAADGDIERYHLALLAVRERGYAVGLEADPRAALGRALTQLAGAARPARVRGVVEQLIDELGHDEYILTALDPAGSYLVNHLVAPVFGAEGTVVLALSVFGFRAALSGEAVEHYGHRLLQATSAVTASIHGQPPA